MKKLSTIKSLFVDIGDVLLTDGWGLGFRERAVKQFGLDSIEMEARHNQAFETFESGKFTLEEYLDRVVFYEKRSFTSARFQKFMFDQSESYPEMIHLIRRLKEQYGLKIVVVSNEARELNAHRIRKFNLDGFVDTFVSSCYVHVRKPDKDIFRLALDTAQVQAEQVIYIENTPMFVRVAEGLGIRSILHRNYSSTLAELASLGLRDKEGEVHGKD